ncbi:MAG: Stp1/IreP family PP2C-type Ser/Thr phosphatase [Anaerolineae bacterium]
MTSQPNSLSSPSGESITQLSPDEAFPPLPEGALLAQESCYILRLCSQSPGHNTYIVEELEAILPCPSPTCGYTDNFSSDRVCRACGAELRGVVPLRRRYQLHEYQESTHLQAAARATAQGLQHTALLPHVYFSEQPHADEERHYIMVPEIVLPSADLLPLPQKLARVLNWGAQLAEGLAYLHHHGICWPEVTTRHILVHEKSALWCDLSHAQLLPEEATAAARARAADVVGLVKTLHYLITGQHEFTPISELPPAVHTLFERVLGGHAGIPTAMQLADVLHAACESLKRPSSPRIRIGKHTDVGMVRELNEDSLLALTLERVRASVNETISLLAVADGMGGHAAGDLASSLAIDTLAARMVVHLLTQHLTNHGETTTEYAREWLTTAVQAANDAILAHRHSIGNNMGTTLVAAVVIGNVVHIANVGDSRAYLLNSQGIRQITTDHSLVERLISLGYINQHEARTHPQRNVIYRTLGDLPNVEADYFTEYINTGDRLLLCSDGLSSKLEDREIWEIVMHSASPQEACERLVQAANERGGEDNISVIILGAD